VPVGTEILRGSSQKAPIPLIFPADDLAIFQDLGVGVLHPAERGVERNFVGIVTKRERWSRIQAAQFSGFLN